MRLTSRARHAVRLALEVARRGGANKPVRLSEIAKGTGLSRRFLEQLAIALKSHSILRGVAGRRGGYLLARPADRITLFDVLSAVIGPIRIAVCADDPSLCISAEFCECRLVWLLLRTRIDRMLNDCSLADISDRRWQEAVRQELRKAVGG